MAAATLVRNTAAGYTTPLQFTETAGGTAVTFWTPQLHPVTLSGMIQVVTRALESSNLANATIGCEVAVVDEDGTLDAIYGIGIAVTPAELASSETGSTFYIAGADHALTHGQRLRVRFFIDDGEGNFISAMASGYTATMYYNGASGGSGDTYLYLPVTLAEARPSDPPFYPPNLFNHFVVR